MKCIGMAWLYGLMVTTLGLPFANAEQTVKVFILAGQSNMEGKAKNSLLEHQATEPETLAFFAPFRNDGRWIERDDAFITFLKREGPLTIGYGSPGCTGPELGFGWMMADHFEDPVLLIKAAWGGHSLFKLFRSPSAGLPGEENLQQELAQAQKRVADRNKKHGKNDPVPTMDDVKEPFGSSYRNMLAEVKRVFDEYETLFPELKGHALEPAGFFWFQGFNDQWGYAPQEYASNMEHFIKDVRKDLNAPKLPFVIAGIGTFGWNGTAKPKPESGTEKVLNGQLAMNDVPAFKGNVKAFETAPLYDEEAARVFPHWKQQFDEWQKVGSDRPYHYLGSALWYTRIGYAAGEAMQELLQDGNGQRSVEHGER